jgi:hypothetical protein
MERIDAFGENVVTPVACFTWSLVIVTRRGLRLVRGRTALRTQSVSGTRRIGRLLRDAVSPYGDALGSLAVLTIAATFISAPLVILITWGADFLPTDTPARHPLAIAGARRLVELAFYYPLMALGVGTLALQRCNGEPIRPSRCIHAMLSNIPKLIRVQSPGAVSATLAIFAAALVGLQTSSAMAATLLGFASVVSFWWIARRAFEAPAMIVAGGSRDPLDVHPIGSDLILLMLILVGACTSRVCLGWLVGCSGDDFLSPGITPQWSRWASCLSVRAGDPLVCLAIMGLFSRRDATRVTDPSMLDPEGWST